MDHGTYRGRVGEGVVSREPSLDKGLAKQRHLVPHVQVGSPQGTDGGQKRGGQPHPGHSLDPATWPVRNSFCRFQRFSLAWFRLRSGDSTTTLGASSSGGARGPNADRRRDVEYPQQGGVAMSLLSSSKFGERVAGVERSEPPDPRLSGGSLALDPGRPKSDQPNLELLSLFLRRRGTLWGAGRRRLSLLHDRGRRGGRARYVWAGHPQHEQHAVRLHRWLLLEVLALLPLLLRHRLLVGFLLGLIQERRRADVRCGRLTALQRLVYQLRRGGLGLRSAWRP
jgi:hypothetical protein